MIRKKIFSTAVILTTLILLTGCGAVKDPSKLPIIGNFIATDSNVKGLISCDESTAKSGKFYVKTAAGKMYEAYIGNTNIKSVTTAGSANTSHYVAFTDDNDKIPTMYKDDKLVYFSNEKIPDQYGMERMFDDGWSIGLINLTANSSNYIQYIKDTSKYIDSSSILQSLASIKSDAKHPVITIAKIGGAEVKGDRLSAIGTIEGMQKRKNYKVELYAGSQMYETKMAADTHYMHAFELYPFDTYTLDGTSTARLNLPDDLQTGYYCVNGLGVVRYINSIRPEEYKNSEPIFDEEVSTPSDGATASEALQSEIDFNVPYYYEGVDEKGNKKTYTYDEWMTKNGENVEYAKTSLDQTFNVSIPYDQEELSANFSFENKSLDKPVLKVTDPDGNSTEQLGNTNSQVEFNFSKKDPKSGTWKFEIYNCGEKKITSSIDVRPKQATVAETSAAAESQPDQSGNVSPQQQETTVQQTSVAN